MTDTYLFNAALLCERCARDVLLRIVVEQSAANPTDYPNATPADVLSGARAMNTPDLCALAHRTAGLAVGIMTDTDRIPEGPHADGGGAADSPQHCGNCQRFLENDLTDEGEAYVKRAMADAVTAGRITGTVHQWAQFYGLRFDDAPRAVLLDDAERFAGFLLLTGACKPARDWCRGKTLREAWAECPDEGWMEWWLETAGIDYTEFRGLDTADDVRRAFPDPVSCKPAPEPEPFDVRDRNAANGYTLPAEVAAWEEQTYEHHGLPVFEFDGETFAYAADDDAADAAAKEAARDSLWAFCSQFLSGYVPALRDTRARVAFDKMREALCEDASELVAAMLGDNLDRMLFDAIGADGRGHFLSPYDGEEREAEGRPGFTYRL